MPRILMTGAAGGIGTSLRKLLPPIYPDLVLSDIKKPADLGSHERFKAADLADLAHRGAALRVARQRKLLLNVRNVRRDLLRPDRPYRLELAHGHHLDTRRGERRRHEHRGGLR